MICSNLKKKGKKAQNTNVVANDFLFDCFCRLLYILYTTCLIGIDCYDSMFHDVKSLFEAGGWTPPKNTVVTAGQ